MIVEEKKYGIKECEWHPYKIANCGIKECEYQLLFNDCGRKECQLYEFFNIKNTDTDMMILEFLKN